MRLILVLYSTYEFYQEPMRFILSPFHTETPENIQMFPRIV